jgi:hypothetical protein
MITLALALAWAKWLEVTGSNPGPGKINVIKKLKKTPTGFLTLKKSTSLRGIKGRLS